MADRENKKPRTLSSFFNSRDEILEHDAPSGTSLSSVDIFIPDEQVPPPFTHASVASNVGTSIPNEQPSPSIQQVEFDASSLERDPGLRTPISQHPVNQRDAVRRAYIKLGPYHPNPPEFPRSKFGNQYRRFQYSWFKKFHWLEYSPSKDAAFCFPCFLFEKRSTLTVEGFKNWKRVNEGNKCPFLSHVGGLTSPHNNAVKSVEDLANVVRHIDKVMNAQTTTEVQENRLQLAASINSIRWLIDQSCALRGHDESLDSENRGNFLEMVKFMGELNINIQEVVLDKAPRNVTYTSPMIQKEILHIHANMVRNKIREELGDAKFCILVDEAKDASNKEQMAIILRYVDAHGFIRERFLQIRHVADTTASTLKQEICDVLTHSNIDIQNMRGQGYDGASNMRGAWNGLQALFLRDCPYAYHVHCFAHRLQLALVGAAEDEDSVWRFFSMLNSIVTLLGASPKRLAELRSAQAIEVADMIATNERVTSRGANQMGSLQRAGKTRWSSHFNSICSLIDMYGSSIQVLQEMDGDRSVRGEASSALIAMKSFEFVFILHMLHKIMGITDLLCQALQTNSLDILNAMGLVSTTRELLRTLREDGFDTLLMIVNNVCTKYVIDIPDMDARYKNLTGRSCQQQDNITIGHHYHFDIFNAVIDSQLTELDYRFTEGAVELLILSSALEPKDGFKSFQVDKICTLVEKYYPGDFTRLEMHHLKPQLEHYELDVIRHEEFQNISTLSELCRRLVETNKSQIYHLIDRLIHLVSTLSELCRRLVETNKSQIYHLIGRLIRLVLTLPVTTATTERAFSAMKIVKTELRNKMEEDYLADAMVIYIEREFAKSISTNAIIDKMEEDYLANAGQDHRRLSILFNP